MVFSNLVFLFVFLPAVIAGYYLIRKELRNIVLLVASLCFYAWGEPVYIFLMLFSIVINYILGIAIQRFLHKNVISKTILSISIIINLTLLGYYKYAAFILSNLGELFNLSLEFNPVSLPIGISFYTFQSISYLVDIYKKESKAQRNIVDLALYISFFPQLVAGPIVRYESIAQQLRYRKESISLFAQGCTQFILGLSKKVLIANQLGFVADEVFSKSTSDLSLSLTWIGIIAYTLQIYFDFSGYSNMAIGLGKMFGFNLPINFNFPYISKSITEFWRRWHITLGAWFRDYVYIPLGGNRVGKWKYVRNLFVVWFLTGLWHGASWSFIFWGLYYGLIIAVEKMGFSKLLTRLWSPLQHIYVIIIVMVGWVFFRADDFRYSIDFLKTMFGMNTPQIIDQLSLYYLHDYGIYFIIGILCCVPITSLIKRISSNNITTLGTAVSPIIYSVLFFLSVLYLTNSTYNPFIYFRF